MVKKILLALFIGLLATLFVAQYDSWVKQEFVTYLRTQAENALDCSIECTARSINFFSPELVIDDVLVRPRNGYGWQWGCKRYVTRFSWWHIIKYGMFDLQVELDEYHAQSRVQDDQLLIAPHMQTLFEAPMLSVPTILKAIKMRKAVFTIIDEGNDVSSTTQFNGESKLLGDTFKTTLYFSGGNMKVRGRTLFAHLGGTLEHERDDQHGVVRTNCSVEVPQLSNGTCFVTGVWQDGCGRFAIRHVEQALAIDPIIITTRDDGTRWLQTSVRLPLAYLWRLISNNKNAQEISGTVIAHMRGGLQIDNPLEGQLIVQDICWYDQLLCSAYKIMFNRRNKVISGSMQARIQAAEIDGSWQWQHETQAGNLALYNRGEIAVPWLRYWYIFPRDISVDIKKDDTGAIEGFYTCKAINTASNIPFNLNGILGVSDGSYNVSGAINARNYCCQGLVHPSFGLNKLVYSDEDEKELITLTSSPEEPEKVQGTVAYSFIRWLVNQLTSYDVQGEGAVQLSANVSKENVNVDMHLVDGTIRLPQTYNFINAFDANLNLHVPSRTLSARDVRCSLHTGQIQSKRAIVRLDSKGSLIFAHVPLIVDRCLLNVKRDLFAMISGSLLFEKRMATPRLSGQIIIDRAQLKENIFSSEFQKQFFAQAGTLFTPPNIDMQLDITVETKYPIRIDTALLQADAAVNVAISKRINDPSLSGSIRLLSGNVLFPYKPLQITRGTITFLPDQLHNPMIELMAKSNIKKYNVTLYANGFLQDHQVILDASPPLTEEQIIALLLVGSEDQSLSVMMPALIVQNLKTALLGSDQASFFDKYLKRSYIPFNINLVPSFTDQTGRGGLRGGIEITVNDRWRALIQKNFSLTEDTRFELEYLLSDDISVRAIRDERRDIGGEVEMRWKF